MTSYGKTIRIYLADGTPTGIRHAELVNWTGQAIVCPRARVSELGTWDEARRPGVCFLVGDDDAETRPLVYIGEAENVLVRLQSHVKKQRLLEPRRHLHQQGRESYESACEVPGVTAYGACFQCCARPYGKWQRATETGAAALRPRRHGRVPRAASRVVGRTRLSPGSWPSTSTSDRGYRMGTLVAFSARSTTRNRARTLSPNTARPSTPT
jgi:hypothetical protein